MDNSTTQAAPPAPPFKVYLPGERPDVNRGPEILASCGCLVGLALFVTCLRIWVRLGYVRKVGLDDYFMVSAVTVLLAMYMIIVPQVRDGAGRHIEYIPTPEIFTSGMHLNFATQPTCVIALALAKISVGFFLLRISPSRFFTRFIWGIIIVTALATIGGVLSIMLQCTPLEFIWNKTLPGGGQCLPIKNIVFASYLHAAISITTDLILALLPVPMLWNVQMNWRVKASVAGILSLGLFTTAAAIIKIYYLGNWGKMGDPLWDTSDITIWYTTEIAVAIVAGSVPCLKPLFKDILQTTSSQRYGSKQQGESSGSRNKGTSHSRVADSRSLRRHTGSHPRGGDAEDFEMWAGPSHLAEGTASSNKAIIVTGVGMARSSGDSITFETSGDMPGSRANILAVVGKARRNSVRDLV